MEDKEILVFSMNTCVPCKGYKESVIKPLMEEGYPIRLVDAQEEPLLARQYAVRAVPTTVFTKGCEYQDVLVGVQTKDKVQKTFDTL